MAAASQQLQLLDVPGADERGYRCEPTVHVDGHHDEGGPDDKDDRHLKVEEDDRCDARDDDRRRRGESLQDVVGELDDDGDEQPADRLENDEREDDPVVAVEVSSLADERAVAELHRDEARHDADDAQLHVAQPDALRRALEDLLEVDARKAGHDARHDDSGEADQRVLIRRHLC